MAKPNVPCEEGRALGRELARLAAPAIERAAAIPCASCAFKEGTVPNGCLETVNGAMECAMGGKIFWCHHGMKDGSPTRVCRGWRALVSETLSTGGHFITLPTGSTDAALSRAQAEGR